MQEQLQKRLEELRKEFDTGQDRLKELEKEQAYIRETLLRISGAIQVLEETLALKGPGEPAIVDESIDVKASGTTS